MSWSWTLPGVGIAAFLLTDIDDLVVLIAFFADQTYRVRDVVAGQFVGIVALLAASAVASLVRLVVPDHVIGLLGIVPAALGIAMAAKLLRGRRGNDEADESLERARRIVGRRPGIAPALAVALVTLANGADNIAVYVPLFASATPGQLAVLGLVFLAATGVWLGLAWLAVAHPLLGPPLARWGAWLLPPVLVLLGAWILVKNGTIAWLVRLR